jgi:subtilisin family serine protease
MKPTLLVSLLLAVSALHAGAQDFSIVRADKRRATLQPDTTQVAVQMVDGVSIAARPELQEVQKLRPAGWARILRQADAAVTTGLSSHVRARIADQLRNPKVAFAAPVLKGANGEELVPTQSFLLKLLPGQDMNRFLQALNHPAITRVRRLSQDGVHQVTTNLRDGCAVMDLAATIAARAGVKLAQPNFRFTAELDADATDPAFTEAISWGLKNTGLRNGTSGFDMNATQAWDVTTGSSSILLAVFDAGIQQGHPEINQVPGFDFTPEEREGGGTPAALADDVHDHGTQVASCISGRQNNGIASTGIAPGVRCMSIRWAVAFRRENGKIGLDGEHSNLIDGLERARDEGARITVHSWSRPDAIDAVEEVFESTRRQGMLHFASTGNNANKVENFNSDPFIGWPAASPHVLGIGAVNRFGSRTAFSQFGRATTRGAGGVDFVAPGEEVATVARAVNINNPASIFARSANGTSFSCPYAAGVAALILSQQPSLTPNQVEALMIAGSRDMGARGWDRETGFGMVNAFRSLPDDHGDTTGAATRIAATSTSFGFFNRSNDMDCFRVTLAEISSMKIYTTGTTPTRCEILNASGALVAINAMQPGANLDATNFPGWTSGNARLDIALPAGTYTIRLTAQAAFEGGYRLILERRAAFPEITVLGNSHEILDGDTTPDSGDHTSFGTTRPGSSVTRTFTIRNDGRNTLRINNANDIDGNRLVVTPSAPLTSPTGGVRDIPVPQPVIQPPPVHFRVTTSPASEVLPGRSTTFTVVFKPVGTGFFSKTLKIQSDDQDEREFDFLISGASLISPVGPVLPR